jgi:putative radical SAM enzyme (TIGR03279 family)
MPKHEYIGAVVESVEPGGIGEEIGLEPGDRLTAVNGRPLRDVLDYQMALDDEEVEIEVRRSDEAVLIQIEKDPHEGLGVSFNDVVFDGIKQCANRCVFCFIHQNPKGMRRSIWVKDDDYRLSFLEGHFITLTNLSDAEWDRILSGHMSPMRVSVHATDPEVRRRMLVNKDAGRLMEHLRRLFEAGISVHTQVVLCPGWNDGDILERTVRDLAAMHPNVLSLAVVPVGLTRFRHNLPDLRAVTPDEARGVIKAAGGWQREFRKTIGTRFVFLGDEFYLMAGVTLPKYTEYEDYPALEDGVGTARLWDHRWRLARKTLPERVETPRRVTVVTGTMAEPILRPATDRLSGIEGVTAELVGVPNRFFGGGISVAGLVTGSDVIAALKGRDAGDRVLVPEVMVRQGAFLDDVTVEEVGEAVGAPVCVVETTPMGLIEGCLADAA